MAEKWEVEVREDGSEIRTLGNVKVMRYPNGDEDWYKNGELHRDNNEPAKFYPRVGKNHMEFWVHGKLHNTDGPAIYYSNGHKQWFVNGEEMTKEEFIEFKKANSNSE